MKATYLVRVHLVSDTEEPDDPPTNERIEAAVSECVGELAADYDLTASSERVDE